jgi:signal transduction histidine kinase
VITALRTPTGELIGFAKVTRDLTERIASQQRAVEDARQLAAAEASNRIKTEFLNSMSHELRTPLNAIGGYVELLRMGLRGPVTEEQRHDLERIGKSQRHLLPLINDILNYSRIEGGHVEFQLEPVPVGGVIESVSVMIEPQAILAGIDFSANSQIDASVLADRTKVEQILLNLLSNAIKFTPEGGRVTVSGSSEADTARISVADTGPGIPEGEVEAIFEPFVQLGRTLSTGPEGTGLGLAISRELARSMHGDLRVTTTPGSGAVFTLELPRV